MRTQTLQVPLDITQQELVRANLGLVGMHVRRHASFDDPSRRDREWEDLFQEGCVGLMRAAQAFDPNSGVPFPAFAIPRIRSAVDRAFRTAFTTVRRPLYPRTPGRDGQPVRRSDVVSLDFDPIDRASTTRHHPESNPGTQTLGQRLRDRYEQHVFDAANRVTTSGLDHAPRRRMVGQLVQHRLLVPDPDQRQSVRSIAQQLGLPHTRVLSCEKQLKTLLYGRLRDDPETRCLKDLARRHPQGLDAPVDPSFHHQVLQAKTQTFLDRLTAAPPDQQARTLLHLIHHSNTSITQICQHLFQMLNPTQQDQALTTLVGSAVSLGIYRRRTNDTPGSERITRNPIL